MNEIEREYRNFWAEIVETNGVMDPEKVKRELFDYSNFMREASEVYMAVSGGRISKPNTKAQEVIDLFEEALEEAADDAARSVAPWVDTE